MRSYKNYFKEVFQLHNKWGMGILYKEIVNTNSAMVLLSDIPGPYFNLATPTVSSFKDLDLNELKETLSKNNNKPSIFLLKEHQEAGFEEYLVRNGFIFEGRDTWVGYDKDTYLENKVNSEVVLVTPEKFSDYDSVLGKVFSDFPGNAKYMEICEMTIKGELKNDFPGLISELYLIYEDGKPASGAGMFYSKEGNFAYLHDAGTLDEYRGKGYQSDLIKSRVNKAVGLGIDRIYSSVDHGGKSWSNSIKCGLNQMHTGSIFVMK